MEDIVRQLRHLKLRYLPQSQRRIEQAIHLLEDIDAADIDARAYFEHHPNRPLFKPPKD